jgi:hypothetical protein
MAFDWDDIAEEFAEATGRAREWFSSDGYGFRRLEKLRNDDLPKLARRVYRRRTYQRIKSDPVRMASFRSKRRVKQRGWYARTMTDSKRRAKERRRRAAAARRHYARLKQQPAKLELLRARKSAKAREAYLRDVELSRAKARALHQAVRSDPKRKARELELARARDRKRRAEMSPEARAKEIARGRERYRQLVADPAKREAKRAAERERYAKRKARVLGDATRRELIADAVVRGKTEQRNGRVDRGGAARGATSSALLATDVQHQGVNQ